MLTPLAFLLSATLATAQPAGLKLTHDQLTFGPLGAPRADANFLPGDLVSLAFDIENLKADGAGKVSYSFSMEVTDGKNNSVLKQEPRKQQALNYFGGNTLPAMANLQLGMDQAPGEYTVKLTVNDNLANQSQTLTRKITVLPAAFGLVQCGLTSDVGGIIPAPPVGTVGETVFLNFGAVGFERAKDTLKQPKLHVELRILDDKGQPTMSNPLSGDANSDIPDKVKILPMQFAITLTRPGTFQAELTAVDQLARKTTKIVLPIKIVTAR